jgi:hypothetical protein
MTELTTELELIRQDLCRAHDRRLRRNRRMRAGFATAAAALAVAAVASASAIGLDLNLDPARWVTVGRGVVDDGKGEYVHARSVEDGGPSTFMVEHDAGMNRYDAFLLHERLKAAADETSPVPVMPEAGPLCTREQLTRIEQAALDALRANASPADATAGEGCRGVAYGIEIAQRVFTGVEPAANLMPGAS